jgi:hypothetical protein
MRRCPYCAEDIEDDTIRCPHCGSQLTATPSGAEPTPTLVSPAPATATATAPSAGATVQFSHTGQRFLLGYDATDFGIWDRSAPGIPVERFPRSDDGWSQAWRRYSSLEPHSQQVHAAPGPGGGGWAQPAAPVAGPAAASWQPSQPAYYVPQQRRQNGMAVAALVLGIVGVLFFVVVIPPLLALVFGLVAMGQIKESRGTQDGQGLAVAGVVLGAVGLVFFVIFLVASINDANPGF